MDRKDRIIETMGDILAWVSWVGIIYLMFCFGG